MDINMSNLSSLLKFWLSGLFIHKLLTGMTNTNRIDIDLGQGLLA